MPIRLDQITDAPSGPVRLDQIPDVPKRPIRLDQIPDVSPVESTALGAAARAAEKQVVPTSAGMLGFGLGTALAAPTGPFAPLVGGIPGSIAGGLLGSEAQKTILEHVPESFKKTLGLDEAQHRADLEQHPIASFVGEFVPQAAFLKPGWAGKVPAILGGSISTGQEAIREYEETGKFDPAKLLIAAGAGTVLQNPTKLGEAVGLATAMKPGETGPKRESVTPILSDHAGRKSIRDRQTVQTVESVKPFISDERLPDVIDAVESGKVHALPANEQKGAMLLTDWLKGMGEEAKDEGVISNLLENFIPRAWDLSDKKTAQWAKQFTSSKSISRFTRHSLKRVLDSYRQGLDLGMKPKFQTVGQLISEYGQSMGHAIENSRTAKMLKASVSTSGERLFHKERSEVPTEILHPDGTTEKVRVIRGHGERPTGFVPIMSVRGLNPSFLKEFKDWSVHPDIIPALKMAFGNEPGVGARSLAAIAYTMKRANVGLSLFHAKSLWEAWVGAGGRTSDMFSVLNKIREQYRSAGIGDSIDEVLRGGLQITAPLEDSAGRAQYIGTLDKINDAFTKINPSLGKPISGLKALDDKLNQFTWNYLHTNMKLATAVRKLEELSLKHPEIPREQLARDAAQFTNTTFGGLNWEGMAYKIIDGLGTDSFSNKLAEITGSTLGKSGRSVLSMLFFAPDWKLSTALAWLRAMPEYSAISTRELVGMHRRYILRSAMMTMIMGNVLNYALSGHSMFENKAPEQRGKKAGRLDNLYYKTLIDMGNGQHMNMFKHFMEFPHWVTHFRQQALNAMGAPAKIPMSFLMDKKFLTPGYSPEWSPIDLMGGLTPITVQQALTYGPGAAAAGFFGFPISGMTPEMRMEAKLERKRKKARELED